MEFSIPFLKVVFYATVDVDFFFSHNSYFFVRQFS
jgi:hypothetical protein